MENYLKDPVEIENRSFEIIRSETDFSGFDALQQQIVMRLVHTCGNPKIANQVRISQSAVNKGIEALNAQMPVLCDVEMVKQGLTKRFLSTEPLCFLNHGEVPILAKEVGETRTMTALSMWKPHLKNSIAIIGNAPTALFRLMEMIEAGGEKPALIIGMPVGFVGAPESKQYLWDHFETLGVECMTIIGRSGGSALAAGAFNTLVRLQRGLRF